MHNSCYSSIKHSKYQGVLQNKFQTRHFSSIPSSGLVPPPLALRPSFSLQHNGNFLKLQRAVLSGNETRCLSALRDRTLAQKSPSHVSCSPTPAPPAPPKPKSRVADLLHIFDWENRVADASLAESDVANTHMGLMLTEEGGKEVLKEVPMFGPPDPEGQKKTILLDGANLAWGYGEQLSCRFGYRKMALSQGVEMAMTHPPWIQNGFEVKAVMPFSYVQGELKEIVDGGNKHTLLPNKVVQLRHDLWRNTYLWGLHEAGKLILVRRPATEQGRKEDDLMVIRTAHEVGAYVCSNDQFRDHRKNKKIGFKNFKRLKSWAAERKFGFTFHVASGLKKDILKAMWKASKFQPEIGLERNSEHLEPVSSEDELWYDNEVPPYHALPTRILPVVFEPIANSPMLSMMMSYTGKRS